MRNTRVRLGYCNQERRIKETKGTFQLSTSPGDPLDRWPGVYCIKSFEPYRAEPRNLRSKLGQPNSMRHPSGA
jgi:hypothetical protein